MKSKYLLILCLSLIILLQTVLSKKSKEHQNIEDVYEIVQIEEESSFTILSESSSESVGKVDDDFTTMGEDEVTHGIGQEAINTNLGDKIKNLSPAYLVTPTLLEDPSKKSKEKPLKETKEPKQSSKDNYYVIQKDVRLCNYPACQGYFLYLINQHTSNRKSYASKFDFKLISGVSILNSSIIDESEDYSVIVYGRFIKDTELKHEKYFKFQVKRLFKQIPIPILEVSKSTQTSQLIFNSRFYTLRKSKIVCVKAPCPNIMANLVNSKHEQSILMNDFQEPYSKSVDYFDNVWYQSKVFEVDEMIHLINDFDGKNPIIISSYVSIPEKPCKTIQNSQCKGSILTPTATFIKNTDRCLQFKACEEMKFCIDSIPDCQSGYSLSSYPYFGGGGCSKYSCYPSFLDETRPKSIPISNSNNSNNSNKKDKKHH